VHAQQVHGDSLADQAATAKSRQRSVAFEIMATGIPADCPVRQAGDRITAPKDGGVISPDKTGSYRFGAPPGFRREEHRER